MKNSRYDCIVIGAGQGGGPIATTFAKKGKSTLLIEREFVGGTCVNRGCTPTKTMVASAKSAFMTKTCAPFGIEAKFVSTHMGDVYRRKKSIVDSFRNSSLKSLQETKGLDLVFGQAKFQDQTRIEINSKDKSFTVEADCIVINTGCRPFLPAIPGLQTVPFLDSTSIMELQTLPKHLLIIGGGYISLEFGQMFCRFGSEVTILERSERLLKREDTDVALALQEILKENGINILFHSKIKEVKKQKDESLQVNFDHQGEEKSVEGSHLLVATGRVPNTDDLGLNNAEIVHDQRGFIQVNERLQTNLNHVFAIGDVKGGPMFTHISYDDYRIIRDNLLENGSRITKNRMIPYTIFTDPQLGRIGLTEEEAKQKNIPYKIAKLPMSHVARAIEIGETKGLMKAIIHSETNRILGCAVLGAEGGEIMSLMQIAMMGNVPYTTLREATFAHPTFAESLNNLFSTV